MRRRGIARLGRQDIGVCSKTNSFGEIRHFKKRRANSDPLSWPLLAPLAEHGQRRYAPDSSGLDVDRLAYLLALQVDIGRGRRGCGRGCGLDPAAIVRVCIAIRPCLPAFGCFRCALDTLGRGTNKGVADSIYIHAQTSVVVSANLRV